MTAEQLFFEMDRSLKVVFGIISLRLATLSFCPFVFFFFFFFASALVQGSIPS